MLLIAINISYTPWASCSSTALSYTGRESPILEAGAATCTRTSVRDSSRIQDGSRAQARAGSASKVRTPVASTARSMIHAQLLGVLVVLGIRLWGTLLADSALTFIGRSRSPNRAAASVEDSMEGRLAHAGMISSILIQKHHHHHGFDAVSCVGYPMATALFMKGSDGVGKELSPGPRNTACGTAVSPSASVWATLSHGRGPRADNLGKYVSQAELAEQTSGGQSELEEASRLDSPPLPVLEASIIAVPPPQCDLCKGKSSSEGHFYSNQDGECGGCQIAAQRAVTRDHYAFQDSAAHSLQISTPGTKQPVRILSHASIMLHNCERKYSVTNVFHIYNLSVVFIPANCRRPSSQSALHCHCGLIIHTVDTSVAVPAQVINYHAYPQVNMSIRVPNTRCDGRAPVTGPTARASRQ